MYRYENKPWLSSYADGVPHEIPEPTESLVDMLDASVAKYADKTALSFYGAETSYSEMADQIARAAEGLRRVGVRAGDRLALVLPNCPQHVVAFYATLRLGAIVVEHNPLYTPRELRHQFEDHGAKVAIVWDKIYDTISDFPDDISVDTIISVNMSDALPLGKRLALRLPLPQARKSRSAMTSKPSAHNVFTWKKLLSGKKLSKKFPRPGINDIALLQYTSGTTGFPKGVILTHRNLRANAMQGEAWVPGLVRGEEIFYGVLPLFHAYGMTLCLTFAMSMGAKLVLFPKFNVETVLASAKKNPPTFLPAVPPIYDQLARSSEQRGIDLSSIRFAISGAMSLPVATVTRWEQATGGLLVEGYGMTESSPVALGNPIGPSRRPGTVGVPFPSTEIRVINPDNPTEDLDIGEAGELLIRGPQVFQGYWGRDEDTAATLLEGGWLRTGDIVTVSEDGFVTVIDRIKEIIITGGFNVSPSEVEETLMRHPDIEGAAVVGLPRTGGGEDVTAVVIVRNGAAFDPTALRDFCRINLTAYKVPKRIVQVDELPRSLIGKVLRRQIRDSLVAKQSHK